MSHIAIVTIDLTPGISPSLRMCWSLFNETFPLLSNNPQTDLEYFVTFYEPYCHCEKKSIKYGISP